MRAVCVVSEAWVKERVASGVEWLDENRPDWVDQINLDKFDIGDGCLCVLGQLYGDYWDSPLIKKEYEGDHFGGDIRAYELGFNIVGTSQMDELQQEWVAVISARKAAAS